MSARACLLGLGTARPPRAWSVESALAFARGRTTSDAGQEARLAALYRRTGVLRRSIAADELLYPERDEPSTGQRMEWYAANVGPLAAEAARAALADAGLTPGAMTHLVTVSCTGFAAPGIDFALIAALGLSPSVQRVHVGFMGCHGLLNALAVARAFAADPAARVLVCAVELCSAHMRYGFHPDRIVPQSLFADGAAALVVGAEDGGGVGSALGVAGGNAGDVGVADAGGSAVGVARGVRDARGADNAAPARRGRWALVASGSRVLPESADAMTWRIGSRGFEMTLSARVPELIGAHLRPWLSAWLDGQGLALSDVRSWAVHPGGPRVLDVVESSLELPRAATAASRAVLAECGNMSSPTVGFILERLRRQDAPLPCVALAFGPGLVAESLLLGEA